MRVGTEVRVGARPGAEVVVGVGTMGVVTARTGVAEACGGAGTTSVTGLLASCGLPAASWARTNMGGVAPCLVPAPVLGPDT